MSVIYDTDYVCATGTTHNCPCTHKTHLWTLDFRKIISGLDIPGYCESPACFRVYQATLRHLRCEWQHLYLELPVLSPFLFSADTPAGHLAPVTASVQANVFPGAGRGQPRAMGVTCVMRLFQSRMG